MEYQSYSNPEDLSTFLNHIYPAEGFIGVGIVTQINDHYDRITFLGENCCFSPKWLEREINKSYERNKHPHTDGLIIQMRAAFKKEK